MGSFVSIVTPTPIKLPSKSGSCLPTDRDALEQRLAQAEGCVAMSKRHIASLRQLAAGLLRDGRFAGAGAAARRAAVIAVCRSRSVRRELSR
jgi:hypothetical protein